MAMDIYLLDENFEIIKIIDIFYSLIWRRKYNEPGDFELHCAHDMFRDLASATYVYRSDRSEIGLVENYGLKTPNCYIKGRFIECLLADRIIYPTAKYTNKTPEYIARNLVATYLPQQDFPYIHLATVNSPEIGSNISTQVTGKNLSEYLYDLLSTVNATYSVTCDLSTKTLYFGVWKGNDRTTSAIFSNEWDNLKTFTYEYSERDYANYALVAGEGEGAARVTVVIDNSQNGRRREIFIDAKDVQREENESDTDYKAKLTQRGSEKLASYRVVETCEADIETQTSLRYMTDYDLGDLCTIKEDEHGIICIKRITEIEEVYESGAFQLKVQFGDGYLIVTKYIERKLT
mgnify:CR=1 FL=1|jgi:hypothetical protein